jgi:hypothetical protein
VHLICLNCGSINHDLGGDPRSYYCGVCGQPALRRVPPPQPDNRIVAAIAGAGLVGIVTGNPVGALFGAIAGLILGEKLSK